MVCTAKTFRCRINLNYIGSGNPYYRGEFCHGCMWWESEIPAPEALED